MSRFKRTTSRRRAGGFSYLWVLMVVALMGIVLTVATELYSTTVQRDKERELIGIGRQFSTAIGRYYESGASREPG